MNGMPMPGTARPAATVLRPDGEPRSLQLADFAAFHEAVHGVPPFPWQQRLLERVVGERRWPAVLDLPTGVGKTSCIDIALFALALDAQQPAAERWCPRRIVMVVDRRVVVDQAAERGRKLLARLTAASAPVLGRVRDALASLTAGEEEPLAVYTLRGGIPKDDGWARTPHQALVVASTVDQIGSRLLIQGYGVSAGMRPVHAGLLGNDVLLLLDEVHLSRPFAQTLDALQRLRSRGRRAEVPALPRRFHRVFLSATPGDASPDTFGLEPHERAPDSPLGARLHAPKPVTTSMVRTRDELPARCAEQATRLMERHDVVAVVVNRVASARATAALLRQRLAGAPADVVLLTGRMRPLDRDDLLARWWPRIASGRARGGPDRKLVVVATQCIEAGADLDFDAIVSESASLDALRQRLGRVDRLGRYGRAEGVVVHVSGDAKDDPVYGTALKETWDWLKAQKKPDFGIERLLPPAEPAKLLAPRKRAPSLLPAYLDLWMQTAPAPAVVPDVALFLHGPQSGPADVQLVWRADLDESTLARDDVDTARSVVAAVRPSSLEAVSVPLHAARAWLRGEAGADMPDVDAVQEAETRAAEGQGDTERRALCWRGDDSRIVGAKDIRPGDTLVVPCRYGGIGDGSFDPAGTEPVVDLAERAALYSRGFPMLRLHPAVVAGLGLPLPADRDEIRGQLAAAAAADDGWRAAWLQALGARMRLSVVAPRSAGGGWLLVEGQRLAPAALRRLLGSDPMRVVEGGADTSTDDEDSFHAGRGGITLARHSADVEGHARRYAQALGLAADLVEDIALAAWLHDIGKADSRFQLLLRGGDEIEYFKDERPWAKSCTSAADRDAVRRARLRSGYPEGARHELQSVAMIERAGEAVAALAHDLDLVLHLVASHHGHCRPFAPVAADAPPVDVVLAAHESSRFGQIEFTATSSDHRLWRLDSPIADRFWRLVERYGWLELCWLEAVLRLADHRASEAEEQA